MEKADHILYVYPVFCFIFVYKLQKTCSYKLIICPLGIQ